jgi:DNA-binding response OmpR family regulator
VIVCGQLEIDTAARTATFAGVRVELRPREFALLAHLARDPLRVHEKQELSSDRSPDQELAAFGQAVRQLREQRGMSVDNLSSASHLPRGRRMSSRRIGRIE